MTCRSDRHALRFPYNGLGLLACFGFWAATLGGTAQASPQSDAIALADKAAARGDLASARAELLTALENTPDNGALRLALGKLLLRIGDPFAAEAEFKRARQHGIPDAELRHLLAEALEDQGESGQAIAMLQSGPIAPRYAGKAAQIEARAWLARGDMGRARGALDRALRLIPRSSGLWVDIALFRSLNADIGGARDAVDYAIQIDGRSAEAMTVKANLVREQAGALPALIWYEKALALNPDHAPALVEYGATLGDLGRYRAMLTALRRATKLDARAPRPFYLQAVLAARAGRYDLARSLLQRTRGAMDEDPGFMLVSAIVELELGGASVAADWADQLLDMQPYNLMARRILAAAEWNAGNADSVLEILEPMVARADADSWSLHLAARAAADRGKAAAAAEFLARASRLQRGPAAPFATDDSYGLVTAAAAREPLNPGRVIPAMRARITAGDANAAISAARFLQSKNPGVADAYLLLGDAEMAGGNYAAAVRAYRDARRLSANEAVALRLANAQQMAGEPEGAASTILGQLDANPASLTANRIAGHLYADIGQYGRAAARFDGVRQRIGGRDVIILHELAKVEMRTGQKDAANRNAAAAYRLLPTNPDVVRTYAQTSAASGDRGTALALNLKLKQMAKAVPTWPERAATKQPGQPSAISSKLRASRP